MSKGVGPTMSKTRGSQQLAYNKARQLAITSDLLDIAGGVEALSKAAA